MKENHRSSQADSVTQHPFAYITGLYVGMTILLLVIAVVVTLRFSLVSFQQQIDNTLRSTSSALAESDMVLRAFENGVCDDSLISYLDDVVKKNQNIDVITLADTNCIRLYHVNHYRIGEEFAGDDQWDALQGESYFSDAEGTMGMQHRFLMPVRDRSGEIVGIICASTTMDQYEYLEKEILSTYGGIGAMLIVLLIGTASAMSVVLRDLLLGYTPRQIVSIYLKQNEVLNDLEEGILSVDRTGRIQYVNQVAERILSKDAETLMDAGLDTVLRSYDGESLIDILHRSTPTSLPNVLARTIPIMRDNQMEGATIILRDRSEAIRQAEELNGTRHVVSALRANSHEYKNQLQVLSGLLCMGHTEEALAYIGAQAEIETKSITPIMQCVLNSNVQALLLGKLSNAQELDIQMALLPNSYLPEHSEYLSTVDLVTIIGNLIENAMEAINAQSTDMPRLVHITIRENSCSLLIQVTDTGIGIRQEDLARIYDFSYSTKAKEGRGVGMYTVHGIVEQRHGSIDIESEPGNGTTFTLIFHEKRERGRQVETLIGDPEIEETT